MKKHLLTIGMLAIVTSIGLTTTALGSALAQQNPNGMPGPSDTGAITSGSAQTPNPNPDGNSANFQGDHAASFAGEERNGLANALTEHGEPQPPSDVLNTICNDMPTAPGCNNQLPNGSPP